MATLTLTTEQCYHCGLDLPSTYYVLQQKKFCCQGCREVYDLLQKNGLCSYYQFNQAPGKTQSTEKKHTAYLDEREIVSTLVDFEDEHTTVVTLYIPAIHCSSCLWLLEHLYQVNGGIVHSRIDFLKKEVCITFRNQEITLRQLVDLLTDLGYEPLITARDEKRTDNRTSDQDLIRRMAVAGFCMGNVMLFTFPAYFGLSESDRAFNPLFGWLNLLLCLPVTFYCSRPFFVSALGGMRNRLINIDAPLALIIAVLFVRTCYELLSGHGAGFADTLSGLVFLLLVGRWVKQRSYQQFSFDRDYRSYFPLAVTVIEDDREKTILSRALKTGDRILIRNQEIVPADAVLITGQAFIDFSFVTGESSPVAKRTGQLVHAGGRQLGELLQLEVVKPVAQSYLTSLWNKDAPSHTPSQNFNDSIARYFGALAILIALASSGYWLLEHDSVRAWTAFTAVLIVACPCVLTLSSPFTLTQILSVFDRHQFYLKNTDVVEELAKTDVVVFDKTGTLTAPDSITVRLTQPLPAEQSQLIASLARNSNHPLSRALVGYLDTPDYLTPDHFSEYPGRGISGYVNGKLVVIGSAAFTGEWEGKRQNGTVYAQIDGTTVACFEVLLRYRDGLDELVTSLGNRADLYLLSGDGPAEKHRLSHWFPDNAMRFGQGPPDKQAFIQALQEEKHRVTMVGDGLNDAGALRQSHTGIAVTDNTNHFSPACDAILDGGSLYQLPRFLALAGDGLHIIRGCLVISASYNLVGVWFAVQGTLSPLTAAVLMPLSTFSLLGFSAAAVRYFTRKRQLS